MAYLNAVFIRLVT